MESDASHLRMLIERVREYNHAQIVKAAPEICLYFYDEIFRAADEAEAFLNRQPEGKE